MLVGSDVLAYEDKFRKSLGGQKELSLVLDVMAAAMWFVIPLGLACMIAIGTLIWIGFPTKYSIWAYWGSTSLSMAVITYLVAVITLMLRIRNRPS